MVDFSALPKNQPHTPIASEASARVKNKTLNIQCMKEEFDKELRELSPLIAYLKKEQEGDAFKVPKFYFDTLADKVIKQAKKSEKIETSVKKATVFARLESWFSGLLRPQLVLGFGASLLVVVAAWFILSSKKPVMTIDGATVSAKPSISIEQPLSVDEPISGAVNPIVDNKMPNNEHKNTIKLKTQLDDVSTTLPNDISINENKEQDKVAGDLLTHPESGLTEAELALYLEENTEEIDDDSSDNNL
ncbi:MAG: hypothetical protein U5L45_01180 [Saprospiraceae bacterium]|nr:hypothetical protein [Saprospiraceae bacterium]